MEFRERVILVFIWAFGLVVVSMGLTIVGFWSLEIWQESFFVGMVILGGLWIYYAMKYYSLKHYISENLTRNKVKK